MSYVWTTHLVKQIGSTSKLTEMFYVVPYIIKSAIETYAFFANLFKMTNPHPDILATLLS